jgi:hypothetical protein
VEGVQCGGFEEQNRNISVLSRRAAAASRSAARPLRRLPTTSTLAGRRNLTPRRKMLWLLLIGVGVGGRKRDCYDTLWSVEDRRWRNFRVADIASGAIRGRRWRDTPRSYFIKRPCFHQARILCKRDVTSTLPGINGSGQTRARKYSIVLVA